MDNHVKNKKYGNFLSISSLTGECAAEKFKNFCSYSLWTCLHHMVIFRSQNKITDFLMILAWASPFKIGDIYLPYLLFADDIVLFSKLAEGLQAQIDLFYMYCEIWDLIISIVKTKIVIYNQIYAKHSFSFTLAENTLEIVDKYKYLGLWCSNNKNIFVKNHSYLAEQARKTIFTIRNYGHNLGHLTPKLSLKVFQAQANTDVW